MQSDEAVSASPPSRRPRTVPILWLLLAASVLGPAVILALFGALSYRDDVARSRVTLLTQVDVLYEHSLRVFDLHRVVVDRVRELAQSRRGDEAGLHAALKGLVTQLRPLSSIWVLDRTGRPLATSVAFPVAPSLDLSDRDYFVGLRDHAGRDFYVSEIGRGRVDGALFFTLAVPLRDGAGRFDGLIAVSADPAYFSDAYPRLLLDSRFEIAGLLRDDGAILARYPAVYPAPEPPFPRLPADRGLLRAIVTDPERGTYTYETWRDGVPRTFAYRRLEELPLYVVVARSTADVAAMWRHRMLGFLPAWAAATVILGAATLFALRHAAREQRALDALRDEVERRDKAEEALRRTQRFEAMGQLTGGVAHDFNNVLQGIGGCLAVLEPYVPAGNPRLLFDAARQSIGRGARLTQALLAFARRQMLAPEPTDLRELLEGMRPLLERTLGGMIAVEIEAPKETAPALVDRAQLESAILNLAINARDAMPGGGRLTLRTGGVTVARRGEPGRPPDLEPGAYVTVSAADTGTGMDEATVARVFEPFFTTKEVGKGSGLGLAMVHGMAMQLGGGVAVASTVGVGTTVTIYLPRAAAAAPSPSPPRVEVVPEEGRSVLLVDDDAVIRLAAQALLESVGYRVLTAGDGPEALRVLGEEGPVDALVTDYAMPGMTGAALAREARRRLPGLPVMVITGYADAPDGLDCDAVLQKPFRPEELTARLAEIVRRGRRRNAPGGVGRMAGETSA
ncbi:response regulator [Azospirillum sp. ST 5-10]|uniref:response regulator n=1 Tax=unclassified Azospirillum TaxID=2630922 RepID=UPI003F4A21D8